MALYRNAAELAIAHGDAERLAQAALGYDDPCWRFNLPGVHAQHLLNQAFQALGEHDSVLRVRLLAGLARVCVMDDQGARSAGMLDDAIAMARGSAIHVH